jgi:hypothetical protein
LSDAVAVTSTLYVPIFVSVVVYVFPDVVTVVTVPSGSVNVHLYETIVAVVSPVMVAVNVTGAVTDGLLLGATPMSTPNTGRGATVTAVDVENVLPLSVAVAVMPYEPALV